MVPSRLSRSILVAVAALFITTSLGAVVLAQDQASALYCPVGDGNTGAPAVGATKPHFDVVPADVRTSLKATGATQAMPAVKAGVYHTFKETGELNVTVEVANIGGQNVATPATTKVRIIVTPVGGSGTTVTKTITNPTTAANVTTSALFPVGSGRFTIYVEVNPDKAPAETCTDSAPNNACGTTPTACTETYYKNNKRTDGLLVAALPDLRVKTITASGPLRATQGTSPDANATITVEIENAGPGAAFNLSALNPGATPFQARLTIPECVCVPQLLTFTQLASGATATATSSLSLQGLAQEFRADVLIDPTGWVVETDEGNNVGNQTLPIPTAELRARLAINLPKDGPNYVLPKGDALNFEVTVENAGDARAARSNGGDFRTLVYRDSGANVIVNERFTLGAYASRVLAVSDEAANLTGTHTFTVEVDQNKDVLEGNENDNKISFTVTVAVYEVDIGIATTATTTTAPPGVTGKIPFELKNTGTVSDTLRFIVPDADVGAVRYSDAAGNTVREAVLAAGATFKGQLERDLPATAAKGTEFPSQVRIQSVGAGDVTTRNVTFLVGDDTVAPTITLEEPSTGFLNGNVLVVRIVDNVAVTLAESDLADPAFTPITADSANGTLYTLDVAGRPSQFRIAVRAEDAAGNTATRTFNLVRDTTPPRITKVTYTPNEGIVAGNKVNIVVEARDDNMDRVSARALQPRPGGLFTQNVSFAFQGGNYILRDWVVPERPGHYIFNITAYDKAGNMATTTSRLTVQGLDIKLVSDVPTPLGGSPQVGQRVVLRYVIENTSPVFETGEFTVGFVLDFDRQVASQRINLQPGERRILDMPWVVEGGPHDFAVVIDQNREVAEDNDDDPNARQGDLTATGNNVRIVTTGQVFPNNPLFADTETSSGIASFGARLGDHWYLPVLMATVVVLFLIAVVLGRRTAA